ncbi:Rv3235 family protein [Brachybacterium squillarum]|uniref:Rv3235 family protein n=1 Tax=Brachybacterium squillarum TaxID=661979 RepID=UPI002221FA8F|nr:Rv3235 family protein [Brachybacterium squillarum]MCW1805246.1 Rv3235 family protein [Brachybacterium squillarum]
MTTTDQRPLPAATLKDGAALAPEDPRSVERMVEPVARFAVEIVRDMRPENALARVVSPEVATMLARRARLTRRLRDSTGHTPSRRMQVTGVHTCIVNETTVEASCVIRDLDRARFLAMRWELRHTGWRVTVLEIG